MVQCGQAGAVSSESPAARQLQGPRPSVFYKATSLWPARLGWPDFLLLGSKNNVFTAQHMRKQNIHLFRSRCEFSCLTLTCSGIWRKSPTSVNLFPQQQQTRTDHSQSTVQSGNELSNRRRKSSCLSGLRNRTLSQAHVLPSVRFLLMSHLARCSSPNIFSQINVISDRTPVPPCLPSGGGCSARATG